MHRSQQILQLHFSNVHWAKSGVICAAVSSEKAGRADHTHILPVIRLGAGFGSFNPKAVTLELIQRASWGWLWGGQTRGGHLSTYIADPRLLPSTFYHLCMMRAISSMKPPPPPLFPFPHHPARLLLLLLQHSTTHAAILCPLAPHTLIRRRSPSFLLSLLFLLFLSFPVSFTFR